MALTTCKECKKEVSEKAKKCPHCGINKPYIKKMDAKGTLFAVLVLGTCAVMISNIEAPPSQSQTKNQVTLSPEKITKETRKKSISSAFSAWNGAHKALEKMIINAMNDPDSYEHIQTHYNDNGKTLYVSTEFRGRNAFGGMVKHMVKATVDTSTGEVIEIISQN